MNIKNIRPTDCPDELTAREVELVRMIHGLSPAELARLLDMIEDAEQMFAEGFPESEVLLYLERNYGA